MLGKNYDKKIEELENRIKQLEENTKVEEDWSYMFRSLYYEPKSIPVNTAIRLLAKELGYKFKYKYPISEKFYVEKAEDENVRVPVSSPIKEGLSKSSDTEGTRDTTEDNPTAS